MEDSRERYFTINGKDYSLKLSIKKKFDSEKNKPGVLRQLELTLGGARAYHENVGVVEDLNSKKRNGKFIETKIYGGEEETDYYFLNILLKEKPNKIIKIGEAYCEAGFYHRFQQEAFEKNPNLFSGWKKIPIKEKPISYS